MKVGVNHTIEVSDEQRRALSDVLDGKVSKRMATRDEFKAFIWEKGESWENALGDLWQFHYGETEPDEPVDVDDLLGDADADPDLEDLL